MTSYLTPSWFLKIGGIVLLALGVLGLITWNAKILEENSVFYLTNGENFAHIFLGVVALGLVFTMKSQAGLLKLVVVGVGIVALFFGVYGFAVAGNSATMMGEEFNTFGVANLENPLDNLLHLVVGVWALGSAFMKQPAKA